MDHLRDLGDLLFKKTLVNSSRIGCVIMPKTRPFGNRRTQRPRSDGADAFGFGNNVDLVFKEPPGIGHHSHLALHYATMSYRTGGKTLHIDPTTEHVDEAQAMEGFRRPEMREPWTMR